MKSLPTWGICEPRGALTMEAAKLAPMVDQVLGTQLERLRAHSDR